MTNQLFEKFREWYQQKNEEEKREIIFILDYVLNYKTHYRNNCLDNSLYVLYTRLGNFSLPLLIVKKDHILTKKAFFVNDLKVFVII